VRAIVVILSLAVLVGCGARSLAPAKIEKDAGPDVQAATDAGDAPAADARCASPTVCNDDPTQRTPAGTCTPAGDYWYCECAPGFSINPKTSLCRPGTACVAAAADEWLFRMSFDASDCATRTASSCDSGSPGQDPVSAAALALPGPQCTLPADLTVRIELAVGCPTLLEARGPSEGNTLNSYYLDYLQCLAASLDSARLACAGASDCVMAEWDTLP
jgi:hypothetical protein